MLLKLRLACDHPSFTHDAAARLTHVRTEAEVLVKRPQCPIATACGEVSVRAHKILHKGATRGV